MIEHLQALFHYAWSFALILSVIVFVHEFGHFIAARLCGVKVEVFSIGFGRELLGRTDRHGTRWKLALWPLGGYVKMYGDSSAASTPDMPALDDMNEAEKRQTFHFRPLWAKAIIVAAGPIANFILSIAVFTYFIFTVGINSTEPVVGSLIPETPAVSAGLKPGDRITHVDGQEMHAFNDIPAAILTNLGKPVKLDIQRGDTHLTLSLTPVLFEEKDVVGNSQKRPLIGIRSEKITFKEVGLITAIGAAAERTYGMCVTTLKVLGQMIRGDRSTDDLKGPLGIAKLSGEVTAQGDTMGDTLRTVLWFIALLSVNLGFVNLLPIPMLDGGHLAFYCVEAVRGRPMAAKFQEWSYRVGFALIAMLMALSLFNDFRQIF